MPPAASIREGAHRRAEPILRLVAPCTVDELVHRLRWTQHLGRDLAAAHRQHSIQEVELDEQRRLVPVEVLVRDLVAFELDDRDEWQF